ncbi:crotonyl-CoA carboxylase/reductase [Paenibacillus popilliae]|uniref:Crotonyl-CoA carboxylase/reductase n=1 Tax=Paenibacillus popilliae TaxID=78057 RepID=A0ABY3ARN5_PAEPP|nr:crotonyl-CoA carboxylase/reductase [Paenibacillus sp. SDF0028]TQR45257.1 crotonyl-CoA carboxylase/reductase [Paenibacillus sp. SDF0028]
MGKTLYEVGEVPPVGYVPEKMYAWTLRNDRLGEPIEAFQQEVVDIPQLKENEMLVLNMACGINYNGVWASLGLPRNVVHAHHKYEDPQDFLICGSESSGIVYAVGDKVTKYKVGDEVICTGIQYDERCETYKKTEDPRVSPSFRIWGYEGNWGAFSQFSKVQEAQCIAKPKELSWVEAASVTATGGTVYNMLKHWQGNEIQAGDIVLVWGGYGGVGSIAIPLIQAFGGIPIAVVSDDARGEYCMRLGAKGYINRKKYNHWGIINEQLHNDTALYGKWLKSVVRIRREIWKIAGERKDPKIVIEHPGADTLPTSMFLCDLKGMVVICGATTGYVGSLDLRYLWLGMKRLQGSHAGTIEDGKTYLDLIVKENISFPEPTTCSFADIPLIHQNMYTNSAKGGNTVALIGAS